MDAVDRALINRYQGGVPVCDRPYVAMGEALGISEQETIERIERLLADGMLTRFGPLFNAERFGGAVTLAAMAVPPADFERVNDMVNRHPEVAHNYERSHELNMWFVVHAAAPADIERVLHAIAEETRYPVYNMPKLQEFFVGLRFEV